jgi:hypothetical protein
MLEPVWAIGVAEVPRGSAPGGNVVGGYEFT